MRPALLLPSLLAACGEFPVAGRPRGIPTYPPLLPSLVALEGVPQSADEAPPAPRHRRSRHRRHRAWSRSCSAGEPDRRPRRPAHRDCAVSARDPRKKNRGVPTCRPIRLGGRPRRARPREPDVDVFVEVMGGDDGPAKAATEGRHRRRQGRGHRQQGAARPSRPGAGRGGRGQGARDPLRGRRRGRHPGHQGADRGAGRQPITRVMGVMNGTCNYILTRMESAGLPYERSSRRPRAGLSGGRPNLDVGGIDAGHKLSLLAAIAFGTKVDFEGRSNWRGSARSRSRTSASRRHGLPDQASGRGADDRPRAGAAHDALPRARPTARWASCRAAPTWWCSKATRWARSCCAAPARAKGPDRQRGDGRRDRHRPRHPPATFGQPATSLARPAAVAAARPRLTTCG
jgi:hypothetical protein